MNSIGKAQLAAHLAKQLNLPEARSKVFVDALLQEMQDILVNGHCLKIAGFGTFQLRDKKARPGRNPKTGQQAEVSARRVVTFRLSPKLKEKMQLNENESCE